MFAYSALPFNSPQTAAILIAIVLVLIVLVGLAGRRQRRRRRSGESPRRSRGRRTKRRHDHGAAIARHHGHERSGEWPRVEHEHIARSPPVWSVAAVVRASGSSHSPFHLHPHLELDHNNLITLCEIPGYDHHLPHWPS